MESVEAANDLYTLCNLCPPGWPADLANAVKNGEIGELNVSGI